LDPKLAQAHYSLGLALDTQQDLTGAIEHYHKALDLDPKIAPAHGALGEALLRSGRFPEAQAATKRALDLLPPGHPHRPHATQQLQYCEQLLALDCRLPAILKGDDQPANATERMELALICQYKRFYAASSRFFEDAFAANPKLAEDLRYDDR